MKAVETFTPPAARRCRKKPCGRARRARVFQQMRCSPACVIFFTVLEVVLGITRGSSQKRCLYAFWAQRAGRVGGGAAVWRLRRQPSRGSVKHLVSREARHQKSSGRRRKKREGRKPNQCREHPDDLEKSSVAAGFTESCNIYTDWETVEEFLYNCGSISPELPERSRSSSVCYNIMMITTVQR